MYKSPGEFIRKGTSLVTAVENTATRKNTMLSLNATNEKVFYFSLSCNIILRQRKRLIVCIEHFNDLEII